MAERDLDAVADRLDAAAALARADYLRTEAVLDDVLPFDSGGNMRPDLRFCLVGRVGLEPTTQGL